jgi:hypothetical protein
LIELKFVAGVDNARGHSTSFSRIGTDTREPNWNALGTTLT